MKRRWRIVLTGGLLLGLALAGACGGGGGDGDGALVGRGLDGEPRDVLVGTKARAIVLLFVAVDCPIANYFAPEIGRIHADYAPRGVDFHLVYGDSDTTGEAVRRHLDDFSHELDALLDPEHELVDGVGATVTPEAAVLSPTGELLYLGRIDDRFVDFGKQRPEPTTLDLRDALDAVLAGRKPAVERTEAIGCFIPD